ncbi:MAG: hypothetical protein WC701_03400 [Kiritimatiellales bacterium]|jgi:uncharacterized integral membrane protein
MKNWKNITLLTLGILLLIISFQNLAPVSLQMLFWPVRISPVVLIPLMLLTGFAAGRLTRRKRG